MKSEFSTAVVLMISEAPALDEITVYLQDFIGKGRITIECFGKCWTTYFGAYGNGTLAEFVAKADSGYLLNCFLPNNLGMKALKQETAPALCEEAYLERILKVVQKGLATSAPTPDTAMKEFREEFINELLRTADIYANLYVQDEADDRECCIFDAQHKDAKALFKAIADAKKALKLAATSAGGRETSNSHE